MRYALPLSLLALTLCGCAAMDSNAGYPSLEERHPIAVDQQTEALLVAVDPSLDGLSRQTIADIDDFVSAYRTAGHGPITVTASSGSRADFDAQNAAAAVRAALFASGIAYEDMRGATVRSAAPDGKVMLSFTRYVATGPVCGRGGNEVMARLQGRPSADFGCATRANLAAMLADPRELHRAAPADGSGDDMLTRAIDAAAAAGPGVAGGGAGGGGARPQ